MYLVEIMKKRGMSHLEIVLSFVIFISFISFALYFFTPLNNTRLISSSLDYTLNEVMANSTTTVTTYSVKINQPLIPEGVDIIAVNISSQDADAKIRVESYTETVLRSSRGNDGPEEHSLVYAEVLENDFIFIKFSEKYNPDNENKLSPEETNVEHNPDYYEIASSNTREVISEKAIKELRDNYENDYSLLKNQFNIPKDIDFSFSLNAGDLKIESERSIPAGAEIFAKKERIEVLTEDNKLKYADFIVKVW